VDFAWIEQLPWVRAIAVTPWLYPVISALHIIGIGLLVGSIIVADLALLRAARGALLDAVPALTRFAVAGFLLAALTGGLLFTVQAVKYAENPAFLAKLALIGLAGLNAAALWRASRSRLGEASRIHVASAAVLSLVLWLSAVFCGRLIGFL
jgi:hypothetical protein